VIVRRTSTAFTERALAASGRAVASYRAAWISVTNGSVSNQGSLGSDADHYVQAAGLRLQVPIKAASVSEPTPSCSCATATTR
jgi:hypothetical protein